MATEKTAPPVTEESKEDVKSEESKEKSVEDAKSAIEMLAQGKRNVICGEIPIAVNQFQEACALLAKQHGETAKECAEAYFCYGQSLLDLARMETGVLGNALQGVDVEEEAEDKEEGESSEQFEKADNLKGEERDKLRDEVYEAMSEEGKETDKKDGADKKSAKGESADKEGANGEAGMEVEMADDKKDEKGDKENSEKKGESSTSKDGDKEAGEGEEEEDDEEGDEAEEAEEEDGGEGTSDAKQEEDADDVSNLQLAWEMLELSKMIYLKDPAKETQLKAAQAYLKLGEVSLETEQYEQATEDFKACLDIQKQHLETADRLLAETHYQLGLACSFDKKFDTSIEHYKAAIKVIEEKIGQLEKVIEENSKGKGKELSSTDDPVTQATQEIKELKEILPDISSKIEDAEEEKKNLEQLKTMTKEIVGETLTTFSSSTESTTTAQTIEVKKASDISHLIRRKRKPDDDADDQESKKSRQEDGSGDAPEVTQNGHDKTQEEAKKEEETPAEAEPMAT